ncbi:WD40 repeat-like protein [Tothia fuscella]|uniref:WD40 repeat-like protein n=1 Tax=Tothia fuscella TaxID=1048955 RepID=A0A9P4NXW0_9PEZI|nr:WD40 repeat-like protein [Tothia fuscella]
MLLCPTSEEDESFESGRRRLRGPAVVVDCEDDNDKNEEIPIASSSKTVTPYLSEHIPKTYNPMSGPDGQVIPSTEDAPSANTKYCNRHRPDRKCRRQANEPSMEQLQSELNTLSQTDQQSISHVWSIFSAAPAKQRNLILQGILSACCFPQLSFISASVRDLINIDFLTLLPPELGFKILCYLDTTSLCKAAQVSRRWRQLADDDVVWHKMCEQHIDRKCIKCGWGLPLLERKRLRLEKRQIQLRATGRGMNEWSPNITPLPESPPSSREASTEPVFGRKRSLEEEEISPESVAKRLRITPLSNESQQRAVTKQPWKDVYKARFKVGINWKHGRCNIKTLKGHTNGVTCLQFRANILASGSYDTTIKIWNMESKEEIRTLKGNDGHTLGVRCLQFDDKQLVSGSLDGTVKIWDWTTGQLIKTLTGPTQGVLSVHFDGPYLCAGSMDNHIYIWNTQTKRAYRIVGHTDFVNSVKLDVASRTLFSASDDNTAVLWDLDTQKPIRIFRQHTGPVQQVLPLPHEFEVDESDLPEYVPDVDTDTDSEHEHHHHHDSIHEHDHQDVPNAHTHESHPRTRKAHATPPPPLSNPSLFPDDSDRPNPPQYILTAALDATICLWHVPTGRCLRIFFGHLEGVWALAADTLRVVSGAEDRMVKVWDPRTGHCEKTYTGHEGPVTCVGLSGERVVSGSEDTDIRVLEFADEGPGGEVA